MPNFKIIFLESVELQHVLDTIGIPHYRNQKEFDPVAIRHLRQRIVNVPIPDPLPEEEGITEPMPVLIVWTGDEEPTDDEVTAEIGRLQNEG